MFAPDERQTDRKGLRVEREPLMTETPKSEQVEQPTEIANELPVESAGKTKRRIAANARQESRRREIVDAAATLFQARGYHATSVGDIADEAGISKPTIYHYFDSKEEILVFIHELIAERLLNDYRKTIEELEDPLDRLRAVCESFFAVMSDLQPHVRTFFASFGEIGGEHRERVEARRLELSQMVEGVITDCVSSGGFREVDPRLTMLIITGVFNWAPNWYNPAGRTAGSKLADLVFDIFVNGLGPSQRPRV